MPLETANYINGLVASNPASTDTVSQADDHIRLIKKVLKDTFPNISAPVTVTAAQLNDAIPVGFIGMWSGSIATIPSGWALCDGSAGRPDLRDRFIVGAGSSYTPGNTGGANTVALSTANIPSHNHTFSGNTGGHSNDHAHYFVTNVGGSHQHSYVRTTRGSGFDIEDGNSFTLPEIGAVTPGGEGAHQHDGNTGGANANHTHGFSGTTSSVGSGTAHENRPPYYALAFIIKL